MITLGNAMAQVTNDRNLLELRCAIHWQQSVRGGLVWFFMTARVRGRYIFLRVPYYRVNPIKSRERAGHTRRRLVSFPITKLTAKRGSFTLWRRLISTRIIKGILTIALVEEPFARVWPVRKQTAAAGISAFTPAAGQSTSRKRIRLSVAQLLLRLLDKQALAVGVIVPSARWLAMWLSWYIVVKGFTGN